MAPDDDLESLAHAVDQRIKNRLNAKPLFLRTTRPITGSIKILRNRPCGCGSGIKAKRCCLPKLWANDAENRRTVA